MSIHFKIAKGQLTVVSAYCPKERQFYDVESHYKKLQEVYNKVIRFDIHLWNQECLKWVILQLGMLLDCTVMNVNG